MSATPRPGGVPPVALREIAVLAGAPVPADNLQVTGVTHTSSEVRPGDLYAALPGARRHGAEFAAQARDAGAVAILTDPEGAERAAATGLATLVAPEPRVTLGAVADAVFGAPTAALTVIGITGTAGKTSTAYLVESGLRAAGHVTGLIGTVETRLGDLVIDSARTTPEAADLHALLAVARERGVTAVVMEVSSHALSLGRVGGVRFAAVGWTNFGMDHLDFHADAEEYFAAKASLFDGRAAVEILNFDDPALRPLLRPGTLTYSAAGDPAATWRADKITGGYDQSFLALGPDGIVVDAGVAIAGRHNVANALLGIALLTAVGVDPATAARGIAACPGVPGRLERVTAPGEILGVVDYAHKPDAIVAALRALRELAEHRHGRLICVIGAGGDRDRGKRPLMGAAAVAADLVLVTDDNPRTEDPAAIRAEVIAGTRDRGSRVERSEASGVKDASGVKNVEVVEVPGRRHALDEAVRRAEPGDVIAVLGKGHERGQEIHGQVLPFDDRIELAAALTARSIR